MPADKFELDVEVVDSGNGIEISFKRLLPSPDTLLKIVHDVIGLSAQQISEIGNFVDAFQEAEKEGKIRVKPVRQILSTDHMTVNVVDDVTCLSFPFFSAEKKENSGKKKL